MAVRALGVRRASWGGPGTGNNALRALTILLFAQQSASQIVAGGMFSLAGGAEGFRKTAQWFGIAEGGMPEWRSVQNGPIFTPPDSVLAMAYDSSLRWLFIGGSFVSAEMNGLVRATLPGPSPILPFHHFFKYEGAELSPGVVRALELWTKPPVWDETRSRDVEWELFVGGDFNRMAHLREEQNPNTARFVARCIYKASDESWTWDTLSAESAPEAPDSPLLTLALDRTAQTLFVAGETGAIRQCHLPTKAWSVLQRSVGVEDSARVRALLFDSELGLGFIAAANQVLVFARDEAGQYVEGSSVGYPPLIHTAHFSSLAVGRDPVQGRRGVWAAGNQSNCPCLFFASLDSGHWDWLHMNLAIDSNGCMGTNLAGGQMVRKLAFVSQDDILIMAGDFSRVANTNASNIAMSRDGGRSWAPLSSAGSGEGLKKQAGAGGSTVHDVVPIPVLDVTSVDPPCDSPLGNPVITLRGSGFKAYPGRHNQLKPWVGDTECALMNVISDTHLTCRLAQGFGANLAAAAGLSDGTVFRRRISTFSYWTPALGSMAGLTNPASPSIGGDKLISIFGRNFGMMEDHDEDVRVNVGTSHCGRGKWISDTSLRCLLAPGVTQTMDLQIRATIGGRIAEAPMHQRFSYLSPQLDHMIPSILPTTGFSSPVTLVGKSFGSVRHVPRSIVVGDTVCSSEDAWISDSSIFCPSPGPGVGKIQVALTVANQACKMSCSELEFNYAAPEVTGIDAATLPLSTKGGGILTIVGSGFGFRPGLATVRIGASNCHNVEWISDKSLVCLAAAGAGAGLKLVVEVAHKTWAGEGNFGVFDYSSPHLESVTPRLVPREGGAQLTVMGKSLTLNPDNYNAVWVRAGDVSEHEFEGQIIQIVEYDDRRDIQEMTVLTPAMPGPGVASFFLRTTGQISNSLVSTCEVGSWSCFRFSERSPTISVDVQTGSDAHGILTQGDGYDIYEWKLEFCRFLDMPTHELVFIVSVATLRREQQELNDERTTVQNVTLQNDTEATPQLTLDIALQIRLYILSDPFEGPWSFRTFVDDLQDRWDTAEGRKHLLDVLGIISLEVGTEEVVSNVLSDAPAVQSPEMLDGFSCVGGSREGEKCAGNMSSMSPAVHNKLYCPGGICVLSRTAPHSVSWRLFAVIGAIIISVFCVSGVCVKLFRLARKDAAEEEAGNRDVQLALQISQEERDFQRALQASLDPFSHQQPRLPREGESISSASYDWRSMFLISSHPWVSLRESCPVTVGHSHAEGADQVHSSAQATVAV